MAAKFSTKSEDIYTPWERQKLAAQGAQQLGLVTAVCAGTLLLAHIFYMRAAHPEAGAVGGAAALIMLLGAVAGSIALHVLARRLGGDLPAPWMLAGALVVASSAAGAVAAAQAGGFASPYSFGLLPLSIAWALVMNGGAKAALLPTGVSLGLHLVILTLSGGGTVDQGGRSVLFLLLVVAGLALVVSEVVEVWRRRVAATSRHDWLTGCLSRERLLDELAELCSYRQRSLAPLCLVMFDVDRFKNVNDAFGRSAGDEVLELLASAVRAEIRAHDFVGRCGPDEFLLVLDDCEGEHALGLIERLRQRIGQTPMTVRNEQIRVTFSAGIVSMKPGDTLVAAELLRDAERALETSKETGRNRTMLAPPPAPSEAITQV